MIADGSEKVGLAQTAFAVDKQRIVCCAEAFGHRQSRGMGRPVTGANHETVERTELFFDENPVVFSMQINRRQEIQIS